MKGKFMARSHSVGRNLRYFIILRYPRLPVVQLSITVPLAQPHRNFRLWYSHQEGTINGIKLLKFILIKTSNLTFSLGMTTKILLQCLLNSLVLKKYTKHKALRYNQSFPLANEQIELRENGKKDTNTPKYSYLSQLGLCAYLSRFSSAILFDITLTAAFTT